MASKDKGNYHWQAKRTLSKNEGGGFDDRLETALENARIDDNYLPIKSPEHANIYIVVDLTSRDHDLSACAYHCVTNYRCQTDCGYNVTHP